MFKVFIMRSSLNVKGQVWSCQMICHKQVRFPDSAVAWKNDKFPKGVKDVGVLTIQVNAQSDDPVK